jgi:hypothetical protein
VRGGRKGRWKREDGRWKREEGRGKQKKKLGEFFFLNPFDTGKDPFHAARGKAAEGFLQGLPGEMFVQKRPHLYPGLPAVDEIPAGEVGLDPAAVIKRHHGPHLGAIDLKKVVLVYHDNLAKSPKTTFCSAGYPPPFEGNSKGTAERHFRERKAKQSRLSPFDHTRLLRFPPGNNSPEGFLRNLKSYLTGHLGKFSKANRDFLISSSGIS